MKKLLLIILAFGTLSVFACERYEAQFVGFASVTKEGINEKGCKLDISFIQYHEHFFCPLLEEDVASKKVSADKETCEKFENADDREANISGILSWDIESDKITITD